MHDLCSVLGWIHLQRTRIAVAFACWNFKLFLSPKTLTNSSGQMRQLYACVANESTLTVIDHYRNNDAVTRFYSGRYRAYENSPICLLAAKNVQQAHNNLPWMSAFYVITFQSETAMYFCIFAVLMQIREVILPQY